MLRFWFFLLTFIFFNLAPDAVLLDKKTTSTGPPFETIEVEKHCGVFQKLIPNTTVEACQQECEEITDFECEYVSFLFQDNSCHLSKNCHPTNAKGSWEINARVMYTEPPQEPCIPSYSNQTLGYIPIDICVYVIDFCTYVMTNGENFQYNAPDCYSEFPNTSPIITSDCILFEGLNFHLELKTEGDFVYFEQCFSPTYMPTQTPSISPTRDEINWPSSYPTFSPSNIPSTFPTNNVTETYTIFRETAIQNKVIVIGIILGLSSMFCFIVLGNLWIDYNDHKFHDYGHQVDMLSIDTLEFDDPLIDDWGDEFSDALAI